MLSRSRIRRSSTARAPLSPSGIVVPSDPSSSGNARLKELAAIRVHYGYRRLHILLRREGWKVNAKRIYRLYTEERLGLCRRKPRRRVACRSRVDRPDATCIDDCWAMDFTYDELFDGRRSRLLTIVDLFTCESLAIVVRQKFRGLDVVAPPDRLGTIRRLPKSIRVDNGTEFTSKIFDQWAYVNGVTIDYSRPGKPTDNAFIESFNGSVRAECLNENWFLSLDDAKEKVESWRQDYNLHRPHSALGNLAPKNSLHQARLAWPDENLISITAGVSENGSGSGLARISYHMD